MGEENVVIMLALEIINILIKFWSDYMPGMHIKFRNWQAGNWPFRRAPCRNKYHFLSLNLTLTRHGGDKCQTAWCHAPGAG